MSASDASAGMLPLVRSDGTRLTLREVEASAIDHALLTCRNASDVARELGIGRTTLYRKVREIYGGHAARNMSG